MRNKVYTKGETPLCGWSVPATTGLWIRPSDRDGMISAYPVWIS